MTGTEAALDPGEERPHPPGDDRAWTETWSFDCWIDEPAIGVIVELTWLPHHGVAWYAAGLVGRGRPYVLVATEGVPMKRPTPSLELRHEGIWAQHVCERPHDNWTVGLEAHGVGLDDPEEAWRGAFGEITPLGLDVEWEAAAPSELVAPASYRQPCRVYGEVLVGHDAYREVEGVGWRRHRWGPWGPVGWWGFWRRDRSAPLYGQPQIGPRPSVLADAPVALTGPGGIEWRERRTLVETEDTVGWLAASD